MRMKFATLFFALTLVAMTPAVGSAQQASLFGQNPIGVTVYVTTSVAAPNVDEVTTVNFPRHETLDATLAFARKAFGSSVRVDHQYSAFDSLAKKTKKDIVKLTLTFDPSQVAPVFAKLKSLGGTPAGVATFKIRNQEALDEVALTKLTKLAQKRAEIIAQADGQHIGRLINASPSFASMLQSLIPTGGIFGTGTPVRPVQLTESGSFTFELLPGKA